MLNELNRGFKSEDEDKVFNYYSNKIHQEGYDLSLSEIAKHLDCSYLFVQRLELKKIIPYIEIGKFIREILNRKTDNKYKKITMKKILFNREEFFHYLNRQIEIEKKYDYFDVINNDFIDKEVKERLQKEINNKGKIKVKKVIDGVFQNFFEEEYTEKTREKKQESIKVYISLNTLKKKLELNYNQQVYRYIENAKIDRYIIFDSLVRYNIGYEEEIEEKRFKGKIPVGKVVNKREYNLLIEDILDKL